MLAIVSLLLAVDIDDNNLTASCRSLPAVSDLLDPHGAGDTVQPPVG